MASRPYIQFPANGVEFEEYVADLLVKLGFSVEQTPKSRDYGADLIIQRPNSNICICVQTKFYGKPVGNSAIQEAVTSLAHYNAQEAWVITNSTFTSSAKTLAKENHVRLIDNQYLNVLIQDAYSNRKISQSDSEQMSLQRINDPLYDEAVSVVIEEGYACASLIQRKFRIGYKRACSIVDELELNGIISPSHDGGKRKVLLNNRNAHT